MRNWLWKYGPSVIRRQLALKRELERLGHHPSPLDDLFVREATELVLLLCGRGRFEGEMKRTASAIDAELSRKSALGTPLDWLLRAHLGEPLAQYGRGISYYTGHNGTPQDHAEAVKWFRKAAEQGHGPAQHHIGIMYLLGEGTRQDYFEADMWLSRALDNPDLDKKDRDSAAACRILSASRKWRC